ncbi:B3 domain-containing transcription factor vrn1 [Thalictrum thalictroides]|uniref:B3 domain-containing transcription factor vrn1 n=1 Tax=Thalictrum thalictroides TaxID=46969 RepID=A0A7J6X9Z0_THATH|nr:B3 domain-containing transcription factor vrn1 [Thalictrum thalictroides]
MFIRNFGRELSDFIVLKVPSGKEWHVELCKEEGRVWFQNGWDTFLDYHSICAGHVLVFKYDGSSQFNVVICECGCEIEYPCDANNLKEANNETGKNEQRRKISKNDSSCLLKSTKKRDEDTEKKRKYLVENEKKGTEQVGNDDVHIKVEKVADDDLFGVNCRSYGEPTMSTPGKFTYTSDIGSEQDPDPCAQFVERPRAFIHDTAIIHEGCEVFGSIFKEIYKGGPLKFDGLHIHEQTSSRPSLNLMECSSHDSHQMKNVKCLQESSSLPNSDVHLHVSNSKMSKIFEADLYRSKKDDRKRKSSDLQPKQQTELVPPLRRSVSFRVKERSITEASAFTSENPFCTVTMRPSYVNGNFLLNIPSWFARTYLKDVQGVTLWVPGGREWSVRCAIGDYFVKLSSGWKAFVLGNQLAVDDICIFELVNRKLRMLKVSIFRVHHNSTQEKGISLQSMEQELMLH